MRLVPVRAALLGVLFAAIVTLPGLGNGTLWDNSETAYGEVAREILLTHDWIVMHLDAQAWFVQPPLYFWIAALFAKLIGLSEFALRLPSAIATIAMGGALGYATARITNARAGTVASVVLSTSLLQAIVGRLAIMDALLDLCIVAAILWWFRALEPLELGGAAEGKRATAFLCGAASLALGTLAKGPVAPVIVVLVIGVWIVWEHRASVSIVVPRVTTILGSIVLFAAITLPWFVAITMRVGPTAAVELIGHYTIGRYTGVIENQSGQWWYYLPVIVLGFFPWIAFLPVAAGRAFATARTREGSLTRLAAVWTIVPLLFFSVAQTKLPNYIAPIVPALAIVVALWFERLSAGLDRRAGIISAATIPLFIGLVGFAIQAFMRSNKLEGLDVILPPLQILGVAMLIGSLATVAALAVPRWSAIAPYVLAATSGALILFIAIVAEPVADSLKPIPTFAHIINAERKPDTAVALRGVAGGNGLVFYTIPPVKSIADDAGSYRTLICTNKDVLLVAHTDAVPLLTSIATSLSRHLEEQKRIARVALLHIDGAPCNAAP